MSQAETTDTTMKPSKPRGISLSEGVFVAFKALNASKMRSALTMLGIIIGVAAVITMVALGTGAQQAVTDRITRLGADLLFLRPGASHSRHVRMAAGSSQTLREKDAEALRMECPSIVAVVPEVSSAYQVKYENKNWNTRVTGSTAEYEWVRNSPVKSGAFFTESDDRRRQRVCVIGKTVVDNLFEDEDPIGRTIKIRNISFVVVGVLKEKGSSGWWNQDDQIIIPLGTAMYRIMGRDRFSSISLRVAGEEYMDQATLEVESVMRRRHNLTPGTDNDFTIRSMSDVASTLGETTQTFTALLASVALVSLIVGGIGIMNIMLVSVTERTREIGVRKAVGARRRDIQAQFLIESIALALAGGLVGISLGIGASSGLAHFYGWNTQVSPEAVMVSFGFAAMVGVFFGFYPARRASRLDPIEALRYE